MWRRERRARRVRRREGINATDEARRRHGTAARRDVDGRPERCNEEAEVLKSISKSLQSLLYQQTVFVARWILILIF